MSDHLTVVDQKLEHQIRATQPGMAHWAGSGPPLKTCRECVFFENNGFYARNGKHRGALQPGRCKKYQAMMQGRAGNKIDHWLSSCKYYKANENPPAMFDK
jgi:hypothetical protein